MSVSENVLDIIRDELEKEGFAKLSDAEIVRHLKAAINNDIIGDMVGMTIYGLLETKLSSMTTEIIEELE